MFKVLTRLKMHVGMKNSVTGHSLFYRCSNAWLTCTSFSPVTVLFLLLKKKKLCSFQNLGSHSWCSLWSGTMLQTWMWRAKVCTSLSCLEELWYLIIYYHFKLSLKLSNVCHFGKNNKSLISANPWRGEKRKWCTIGEGGVQPLLCENSSELLLQGSKHPTMKEQQLIF